MLLGWGTLYEPGDNLWTTVLLDRVRSKCCSDLKTFFLFLQKTIMIKNRAARGMHYSTVTYLSAVCFYSIWRGALSSLPLFLFKPFPGLFLLATSFMNLTAHAAASPGLCVFIANTTGQDITNYALPFSPRAFSSLTAYSKNSFVFASIVHLCGWAKHFF